MTELAVIRIFCFIRIKKVLNEASITMADGSMRTIYDVALRAELAHVDGLALAGMPGEWGTYSWTSDGGFGVAHIATGHSGLEDDLAALQELQGGDLISGNLPVQDLERYVDSDDSLAPPSEFTFDPNDPLTPTFGLKPLVFDLDGDGIDLIDPGVSPILWDANGDGAEDRMGWVSGGDGFLALDRNLDGVIDPVSEISFVNDVPGALTDLEGLRAYDTNQDGWLDAADTDFDRFQIWQDVNYNAISEVGELSSLTDIGIARIHLTTEIGTGYDGGPLGNRVFGEALFEWSDGSFGRLGDVELRAFEGNALEQAVQAERRAALLATGNLGAAAERARRHDAISQLGLESSGVSDEPGQLSDKAPLFFGGDGSRGEIGRELSDAPVSRQRNIPSEGLLPIIDLGAEWRDVNGLFGRFGQQVATMSDGSGEARQSGRENWWLNPRRASLGSNNRQVVASLLDRMAEFDLARESAEMNNSTGIGISRQSGEILAERQRFLQAIASFRGSSGVPLVRRYGEQLGAQTDQIGVGASWLGAGRKHLS